MEEEVFMVVPWSLRTWGATSDVAPVVGWGRGPHTPSRPPQSHTRNHTPPPLATRPLFRDGSEREQPTHRQPPPPPHPPSQPQASPGPGFTANKTAPNFFIVATRIKTLNKNPVYSRLLPMVSTAEALCATLLHSHSLGN